MSTKKKTSRKSRPETEPVSLVPLEDIVQSIRVINDQRVILDVDIARLYEVEVRALVQAVKRNLDRFPQDFMFQLSQEEWESLESQIVTLKGRGQHRKYAPYAFTEQGVAMLSSVLRSKRAIQVNIAIMRAFVAMRKVLASSNLLEQVALLERKYGRQFKSIFEAVYEFRSLFEAVYVLLSPPPEPEKKRPIGFGAHDEDVDDA